MLTSQFVLPIHDELLVDEFACGGGMSEAIEQAVGRHVDISVNHDDDACSMHQANHPQTVHFCNDVFKVHPRKVTGNRPVGLLHLSPDCTDHSQAKGGQPRSKALRALSWIGVRWAGQKRPRIITLENVKQILQWGSLIAKRDPATRRVLRVDGTVAAPGERVPVHQQYLIPDPKRLGQTWRRFTRVFEEMGYDQEAKVLCAADYGAPTTRTRLFWVARCDGAPIVWPEPTHFKAPAKSQKKWRAAYECIDFSITGVSIFQRPKELADATKRRIALGMKKFVLDCADPFIVPVTHSGGTRVHDIRDPFRTITAAHRGELMLAEPKLVAAFVEQANGGFYDGAGRRADQPLSTTTGRGSQQRLVTATLAHLRGNCDARNLRDPLMTVSAGGQHHALVAATLVTNTTGHSATDLRSPAPTIATGGHHALLEFKLSPEDEAGALRCAAFLLQYYSEGGQWGDLRDPMNTITTKDRMALVTVWIKGTPLVVVDIYLRMLLPRELYNANGFPASYIIDRGHDGRVFSKSTQVRMCGNAVPPPLGRAVIHSQWNSRPALKEAA